MKRKSFVTASLGVMLLLAVTLPLAAQTTPAGGHIFRTPIRILPQPDNFASQPSGYFPAQMRAAYRFNAIPNQGQGVTVGIVDACDDPDIEADLGVFSAQFNLPSCTTANGCFHLISQANLCSGHTGNWALEQSLDVQWVHAMAPLAHIVLVQSSQPDDTLFMGGQQAVTAGASVVSMSWGGGEFDGEQTYDTTYFSTPNITYLASTGDSRCGAQYPAASPNVVAVGGTTLSLISAAPPLSALGTNYGSESAWSGSGGGISAFETTPLYQSGVQSTGFRTIPDVALDANPATGVPIYDSYDSRQWVKIGGTSLSAPVWGAFFGIVNSVRGAPIEQPLPDLYALYQSGSYASDFHDVTTGSSGGVCIAGVGYDFVTGIGTPIGNHLVTGLMDLP
jgi:subtilase family serine protease